VTNPNDHRVLKVCTDCGLPQPLSDFGPEKRHRDGLKHWCKSCLAARMRRRRDAARAADPQRNARLAEQRRLELAEAKVCTGCGSEKSYADFAKSKESPGGLDPRCKDCNNRYMRDFYARDLENRRTISREKSRARWLEAHDQVLEYHRAWQRANRDRMREAYARRVAVDPNKEREKSQRRRAQKAAATVGFVDLDLLWVRQCGVCSFCDEPIDQDLAWPHPLSASLDHRIPLAAGGQHMQANLQWVHLQGNWRKSYKTDLTATPELCRLI
jgi:hypothetical protein